MFMAKYLTFAVNNSVPISIDLNKSSTHFLRHYKVGQKYFDTALFSLEII